VFWKAWAVSPVGGLSLCRRPAYPGPCPDQVGFEFCNHGQDVEEEPANGIGRVVDGAADAQRDFATGEFVNNILGIAQRPVRRSSLVTTRVSPSRQAASASLSPGRARVAPVRPGL
jgi:hypothetical protein